MIVDAPPKREKLTSDMRLCRFLTTATVIYQSQRLPSPDPNSGGVGAKQHTAMLFEPPNQL